MRLKAAGVADDDVTIAFVPGSFELPLVAKRLAESGLYDAVLCLGCVIRGQTSHYEHVAYSRKPGHPPSGVGHCRASALWRAHYGERGAGPRPRR